MIRRDEGRDWLLITQADHAAVAARLAGHVGGRRFAPLGAAREAVVTAAARHGDGWREADDADPPPVDGRGRPLDAADAPGSAALAAWAASADAAADPAAPHAPYAGLLVSLYALAQSVRSDRLFNLADPHQLFALNKFQHREVERQGQLRRAVGLPLDVPLHHGVADPGTSAADDRLAYHFRLLQVVTTASLCACRGLPGGVELDGVMPAPAAAGRRLRVGCDRAGEVRLSPWPFDVGRLELTIRGRRLPTRPTATVEAYRAAWAAADVVTVPITVRP